MARKHPWQYRGRYQSSQIEAALPGGCSSAAGHSRRSQWKREPQRTVIELSRFLSGTEQWSEHRMSDRPSFASGKTLNFRRGANPANQMPRRTTNTGRRRTEFAGFKANLLPAAQSADCGGGLVDCRFDGGRFASGKTLEIRKPPSNPI